eukprot:COSAG04_NODE_3478_length_2785_cov_1.284438_3_plen_91_part_00
MVWQSLGSHPSHCLAESSLVGADNRGATWSHSALVPIDARIRPQQQAAVSARLGLRGTVVCGPVSYIRVPVLVCKKRTCLREKSDQSDLI